jgi:DNA polymerase-3 subunit delta'
LYALLPWQRSQWNTLLNYKALGRFPHALLCSGPAELGKERFANCLAQALLCATPSPHGMPCQRCRSCRLFVADSHPDYCRVTPAATGKPIAVEQVRELQTFLHHTSQFGGAKIALLLPAEKLTLNAANSLLKTLEEPPPGSVLLLLTTMPLQLPATVRSRCQRLLFPIPAPVLVRDWLANRVASTLPLERLLQLSDGSPLRAERYSQNGSLVHRATLFAAFQDVVKGAADPVQTAALWLQEDVADNFRWLISWHMDMIRLKMMEDPPWLSNPDLHVKLQQLADKWPLAMLFQRLDAAIHLRTLLATQVNLQLMVEAFLGDCVSG